MSKAHTIVGIESDRMLEWLRFRIADADLPSHASEMRYTPSSVEIRFDVRAACLSNDVIFSCSVRRALDDLERRSELLDGLIRTLLVSRPAPHMFARVEIRLLDPSGRWRTSCALCVWLLFDNEPTPTHEMSIGQARFDTFRVSLEKL